MAEGIKHGPARRLRVQGITSNLDDIVLRGEKWKAKIGDAIVGGRLVRSIGGASTVEIAIRDHNRKMLNSPLLEERYDIALDGLPFRFVKATSEGRAEPLTLVHEARAVALLRALHGPHKAYRDKMTRAEFAKRRVDEADPSVRFICPQLHRRQPIRNERDARERRQQAQLERGKGIDDGEVTLTVKGDRATSQQLARGDRALRVAEQEDAPARVMVALIMALIVESLIGGISANVLQVIPSTAAAGGFAPTNLEASVRGFLTGYYSGHQGAIAYYKANPDAPPHEIAQAVQASGAGQASGGAANYGPYAQEARRWVESYGGGEISTLDYVRYAFEQGRKESNWACIRRLAQDVRWRCFESADWIYYVTDEDLMRSMARMVITDSTPGIEDTSFDYDVGKEVTELRVTARARAWAAPPGACALVRRHGPANGRYLVHRIESSLARRNSPCDIILRRPTEPLPEPAPETKTRSVGFGPANAPLAVGRMIAAIDRIDKKSYPYVWGGGHGSFDGPYDCSGFVSAVLHAGGLLDAPLVSGALAGKYQGGEGEWFTLYADAGHVFAKIRTASGWRYFGTSHSNPSGGAGWVPDDDGTSGAPARSGKAARHPKGL